MIDGFCGRCGKGFTDESLERRPITTYVGPGGRLVEWTAVLCSECARSELAWEIEYQKAMIVIRRMKEVRDGVENHQEAG